MKSKKLWIKNTGAQIWDNNIIFLGVDSNTDYREWQHPSWADSATPSRLLEPALRPGKTGTFLFTIKIPSAIGDYTFGARPKWRGSGGSIEWVTGSAAEWHIKVRREKIEIAETENSGFGKQFDAGKSKRGSFAILLC